MLSLLLLPFSLLWGALKALPVVGQALYQVEWGIQRGFEAYAVPALLWLVEKNIVPDFLIRAGMRMMLSERLKSSQEPTLEKQNEKFMEFRDSLTKYETIAVNTVDANEQHYEVPAELFYLTLGPYLKYSSCYWPHAKMSLPEAEEAMFQLVCERARLAELPDGARVLDLGCGWGSFSLYGASHFPRLRFTGLSNSNSQREFIMNRARDKGLNNVEIVTANVNDWHPERNDSPHNRQFDRIVSNEMFEHMKNYRELMFRCSQALKPDGLMFVHIFTHKSIPYHFEPGSWMADNFFTGGTMPSRDLLLFFQDHMSIVDVFDVDGRHYGKTLRAWLQRLDANKAQALPIFGETYGKNNATKWYVNWRLFYMACEELFNYNSGQEWGVTHYVFKNRA